MNGVCTDHLVSTWAKLPLDVIALDWRSLSWAALRGGVTTNTSTGETPRSAYLYGDTKTIAKVVDEILMDGVRHGKICI